MQQVLFWIPIKTDSFPDGIPIYAYGAMLFCAFVACVWFAGWRAKKIGLGVPRDRFQDLAIVLFIFGLIGARLVYMWQFNVPAAKFFRIWEGGIVLYGGIIGGALAFIAFHHYVLKRFNVTLWQMADLAAPCVAIGVAFGRVGCLLNGCCWGNVACPDCPEMHFPLLTAPSREMLVDRDALQTTTGFSMQRNQLDPSDRRIIVGKLEPGSDAEKAGLKEGDRIVRFRYDGGWHPVDQFGEMLGNWPRGRNSVQFAVERDGREIELSPYSPRGIGLHPTQLYEVISMLLALVLCLAYYPYRRHDGQVWVLFMAIYAVHRFLNEILRTEPVEFGRLTLSQGISVGVFLGAVALEIYLRKTQPRRVSVMPNASPGSATPI